MVEKITTVILMVSRRRCRKEFDTESVRQENCSTSCRTRKLSDKTQPNYTRQCRTVSLSITFRVEHFPRPHTTLRTVRYCRIVSLWNTFRVEHLGQWEVFDTESDREGNFSTIAGVVVRLGPVRQLPSPTTSVSDNFLHTSITCLRPAQSNLTVTYRLL